ncbi:MAG TPA: ankyrin repeat domain-containing protein, partial [archaeon]|nr:ankyrin repeat domain-containing protein [archaeon]
ASIGCDVTGTPPAIYNPDHFTEFNLDVRSSKRYALLYAVKKRMSPNMLNFLIDAGSDVNWRALDGVCALHIAAECGQLQAVELLLERGAKPNVLQKRTLASPLTLCLERMVNLRLLAKESAKRSTYDFIGLRSELQEVHKIAVQLLDHGASVKWARTSDMQSPLYYAAENRLGLILLHPSFDNELTQLWRWPWSWNPLWWVRNIRLVVHNPRITYALSATAAVIFTLLWGVLFLYWNAEFSGVQHEYSSMIRERLFERPFVVGVDPLTDPFARTGSLTARLSEIRGIDEFWLWLTGPLWTQVMFPKDVSSNCGEGSSSECRTGFFLRFDRVVTQFVQVRQLRVSS